MSFPKYPAYKDSGVEWLGDVPSHWIGPKKFGGISSLKGRLGWQGLKADEYREEGPFVVSSAHFSNFKIRWDECPHVSWERYELDANIQLSAEDILLMKDGAALGKLAFVDELPDAACLNSHLLLFRPLHDGKANTYIPKFAFYYMQTPLFQEFMQTRGTGATFMGVSQETISRHLVYWPHHDEQRTIALFLDREAAKIDALVAEQEQLITLLKEKRQAVISHAVTKGLHPSVPMKDSGVEWLGDVPAHWEIKPIGHVLDAIGDVDHFMPPSVDAGVPYLMTGDLRDHLSAVSLDDCKKISRDDYSNLSKRIKSSKGDVIMARYATIGTMMYVDLDAEFLVSYSCVTLKPNSSIVSGDFLFCSMRSDSFRLGVESRTNTNTQGNVGIKDLRAVKIAVPPSDEQLEITSFLNAEITKLDEVREGAERAITLMTERRSALISAAVTGQIDVRCLEPAHAP